MVKKQCTTRVRTEFNSYKANQDTVFVTSASAAFGMRQVNWCLAMCLRLVGRYCFLHLG